MYRYTMPSATNTESAFKEVLTASLFINGGFFLDPNIEAAFRSGVFATERDLSRTPEIRNAPISFQYDSVFLAREYQEKLLAYQESAKSRIISISEETASSIASNALLMMANGDDPSNIEAMIIAALLAMQKKMERVIITTVNQSNSQGRMIAAIAVGSALGLEPLVEHRSALLPTTRATHAARHRKIYTVKQQNDWWATGANRINCYCSVRPVLKK